MVSCTLCIWFFSLKGLVWSLFSLSSRGRPKKKLPVTTHLTSNLQGGLAAEPSCHLHSHLCFLENSCNCSEPFSGSHWKEEWNPTVMPLGVKRRDGQEHELFIFMALCRSRSVLEQFFEGFFLCFVLLEPLKVFALDKPWVLWALPFIWKNTINIATAILHIYI